MFSECFKIFSKNIKTKKEFNFKKILKIIIKSLFKSVRNWLNRIWQKFLFFCQSMDYMSKSIYYFRKRFNSPKKLLKLKRNFRLVKALIKNLMHMVLYYISLINEIFLYWNRIKWLNQWNNLIRLLMNESVILSTSIYFLLFIFLGIFGLLLGLLLGLYKNSNEIFIFLILILLKIIVPNELNNNVSDLDRIFPFEFLKFTNPSSSKIFLKKSFEEAEIPFPILGDPIVPIDIDVSFYEFKHFQFQLFYFYQDVTQGIKS